MHESRHRQGGAAWGPSNVATRAWSRRMKRASFGVTGARPVSLAARSNSPKPITPCHVRSLHVTYARSPLVRVACRGSLARVQHRPPFESRRCGAFSPAFGGHRDEDLHFL